MRLIAKKPCSFGGHKFKIGNEIPVELVANPKAQERRGVISISDGEAIPMEELQQHTAQVGVVKFEVAIHAEDGDLPLQVTNEELSIFTDILQIGVSKAEDKQKISEMIQKIESEDLLIMLDALDGRKLVKEEAQARAQAIHGAPDGSNPDGANPDGDGSNPDGDNPDGNGASGDGANPEGANTGGDE